MNGRAAGFAASALVVLAVLVLGLGAAPWLWLGAIAAALLLGYARVGAYALLVVAAPLAGLAVGLLLGPPAAVLAGVGAGLFAVARLEPVSSHWALLPAGLLVALGALVGLWGAGLVGLVLAGLALAALALVLGLERSNARGWCYAAPASSRPLPPLRVGPALEHALRTPAPLRTAGPSELAGASSPESEVVKNALQGREGGEEATTQRARAETLEGDAELYRRLESWRKHQARSENKPAYIVLSNASLERIAREKPRTLEALRAVKGIGPVKLERYGEEILTLVEGGSEPEG